MNPQEHQAQAKQKQLAMAKLINAKNQRAGEMYEKILNEEAFPHDRLSDQWKMSAAMAIMKTQPITQRVPVADFAKVVGCDVKNGPISLFQFGVLNNSIEAVSPEDLHMCQSSYVPFIDECVTHINYYQARVAEIKKQIETDVENEFKMKNTAAGSDIMKPIMGQA